MAKHKLETEQTGPRDVAQLGVDGLRKVVAATRERRGAGQMVTGEDGKLYRADSYLLAPNRRPGALTNEAFLEQVRVNGGVKVYQSLVPGEQAQALIDAVPREVPFQRPDVPGNAANANVPQPPQSQGRPETPANVPANEAHDLVPV